MSKVVIERPRHGHYLPSMKTGLRITCYDPDDEYEDLPKRAPASQGRQKGERKYFSDLLGPLRRYLRSNVGRPWDKVYSEMKQHLDSRKTTGQHIFEHVQSEVSLHCYEGEDGVVYEQPWWGEPRPVRGLYVHPRTGLLCWKDPKGRGKGRRAKSAKQEITRVPINQTQSYLKLNGIWYIADLEDNYLREKLPAEDAAREVYEEGYCQWLILRKKQCSRKELKAVGLSNTLQNDRV